MKNGLTSLDPGPEGLFRGRTRRDFLRAAGLGGAALCVPALIEGCSQDSVTGVRGGQGNQGTATTIVLDFSTDVGVLNYAYALEQLEAAFYVMVAASFAGDLIARERIVLTDVRDHEVVHRDFFKTALGASAIPALTPNFSSVNFASRTSVLTTARVFEDLGVAAYNGSGKYLKSAANLTVAGKIVSVEARHAAAIRDLLQPRTGYFAGDDVIDQNGLDRAFEPGAVLQAASPFIQETITVTGV